MNVDSSVNISNKHVNAVVSAGNTSVSADVDVNNRNVQSEVQQRNGHVEAQAQTRSGNVHTEVNQHISVVNDHSRLQNLDYDNAGHTGFQRALSEDNAGTGISIETDPVTGDVTISNTQTSAEWGNIEGDIADQTDLNNILTGLDNDITSVEDDVDDIQELIPVQATPQNQLADKDFVNSSIATSTATFRETYNVVTDLHLSTSATHQQVATALGNIISVADNNDYCFVEIPTDDLTPTETLQVDRYKYNGTSWSFEYTLNNSGYTSAQWKAINSGITSGKVTQYDDYATSKQDTLIAGTNITIGTDGKTISSDIPQATQSVAGKVLLGTSGGAATYESVENRLPICYPTTASEVGTTSMLVKSCVSDNGKILTENGFVYNTSGNPTISDTKVICDLGVGYMEKKIENLTRNTEYHIKSYGQNASGVAYGSELVQRTKNVTLPSDYPEFLQLWLRADSVELTDGKVSRWYDLSPNQYEIVQTNANARPIINNHAINGLPTLVFDGASTYLDGGNIINLGEHEWTWFIIAKRNDDDGYIIGKWSRTYASQQNMWLIRTTSSLLFNPSSCYVDSNIPKFEFGILGLEIFDTISMKHKSYINSYTSYDYTSFSGIGGVNNLPLYIGGKFYTTTSVPGGYFLNGEIAEIIAFNTINETMRNNILWYLSERYNIPLDS